MDKIGFAMLSASPSFNTQDPNVSANGSRDITVQISVVNAMDGIRHDFEFSGRYVL
jgi:hypothetical protein